jgi:hypothetical protein
VLADSFRFQKPTNAKPETVSCNLDQMDEKKYLNDLRQRLLQQDNFSQVVMTRDWAKKIPSKPGVYVFKDNDKIVYVGETGNLRGRMKDLLDSRHHTIRRTIGVKFYSTIDGFVKATTKIKFPEHIELLVNEHICKKLLLAYIPVSLGRKELEEMIESDIDKEVRLNKRGKRKAD